KVDKFRQNARRLYDAFPEAVTELGIRDLLDKEITDADGIANWTDSIYNASVPLPPGLHTGALPQGGGVHHYPSPIVEIALFRHDDSSSGCSTHKANLRRSHRHHRVARGMAESRWSTRRRVRRCTRSMCRLSTRASNWSS